MQFRFGRGPALFLVVSLGACFEDPSIGGSSNTDPTSEGDGDGDPSGDGDGDPGDGDPTGGGSCEPSEVCVDAALVGWQGPLAVYVGPASEPPPTCQADTPVEIAELFDGLDLHEGADTCACECGPLSGASCAAAILEQQASCDLLDQNIASWNLPPGNCVDFGTNQVAARYQAAAPPVTGGSCTASLVEDIVEADYANRIVACGVADNVDTCAQGVCLTPPAAPFDGRICIAAQGDLQCPSGAYSERSVYYSGADDQRACAECECTPQQGATCGGTVTIAGTANCASIISSFNVGTCSNSIANARAARFAPSPINATCDPSQSAIEGEVEATGAWTFCCQ